MCRTVIAPEFQRHLRIRLPRPRFQSHKQKVIEHQIRQVSRVRGPESCFYQQKNCCCNCLSMSNRGMTVYLSPPLHTGMFCTRCQTYQGSPKCCFACLCYQFCKLPPDFLLCYLWRGDLNSHSLQPKFPHV